MRQAWSLQSLLQSADTSLASLDVRNRAPPPKVDAVSTEHDDANEDEACDRCHELVAEVTALLAQVAELRAKNLDLLRAAVQRDYERPPHY
jgi:hypothetical protein